MKRFAVVPVISLLFLSGCTQEVPASTSPSDSPGEVASSPVIPSSAEPASASVEPSESPSSTPQPTPSTTASVAALLSLGDSGDKVRELQHRLLQIGWFEGQISGNFDDKTKLAVEGFQAKRGLPVLGFVDQVTMDNLTSMTRKPTEDEMNNALKGYQGKRQLPVTGEVDQRTLDRLNSMTRKPSSNELDNVKPTQKPEENGMTLDDRCLQGRVLCISKAQRKLAWVIAGQVQMTLAVRFGSDATPTRNGVFSVGWKSRDHVSTIYHTPMPYAMFFSGGQAVHYSADFAQNGYNGASHGCVNVRDKGAIASLFDQVSAGDKVVVYAD